MIEDIAINICSDILLYIFGEGCFNSDDPETNKKMDECLGHFFPFVCDELRKL